jgi:hypothetical protein
MGKTHVTHMRLRHLHNWGLCVVVKLTAHRTAIQLSLLLTDVQLGLLLLLAAAVCLPP